MSSPEPATSAASVSDHNGDSPSTQLTRSAGVIGAATLTSRLLGLLRDQVLAYLFGAGNAMDAFNVATRIPNLLRDLFAEGAMSAAFVPAFMRRLTKHGKAAAWQLGNQLVNTLLVVTGAIVLVGIIWAEPIAGFLAGSYADVPGKLELTVLLTRLTLPFLTLVATAAALMGMLNSLNRFFVPALSPAMYNVGVIAGGAFLVPVMPGLGLEPIVGIAIGALLGGIGQVAIQLPALYQQGFRYKVQLNPKDSGLHEILRLMGPGTIAGAAVQINLLVNMVLATGQGTGAVSWLGYAFRVMYLPIGLFGVSIASAVLPTVSRHAAQNDTDGMRATVARALRLMLVLNVPATVGLVMLGEPIVELLFERGSFGAIDTTATTAALLFYAPGLIGYSAVRIAVPAFYALGNSLTPAYISVGAVTLNIILNLILVNVMGYQGLALGTTIAALFNAVTLLWLLNRRLGGLELPSVMRVFLKITAASIAMGWTAVESHAALSSLLNSQTFLTKLATVSLSVTLAVMVLWISAKLIRLHELGQMLNDLKSKITPR